MKYKLLVLDVDGTLLNENKEITQRTQAALLKAQQMGVHVVLASGRANHQRANGRTALREKDRARDDPLPGAKGDQEQFRDIHL